MAVNFLSIFTLCLLPIFAGLIVFSPIFRDNTVKIRRFAKGFCSFSLIYTLFFILLLNSNFNKAAADAQNIVQNFNFTETLPFNIIPNIDATISFGLDSFSILMCILTSFIMLLILIVSKSMINSKQKMYYGLMLLMEGILYGLFAANNLFTFFIFWQLTAILAYFLIAVWGTNSAKQSALKFALFNTIGAAFMLIASALIYAYCADANIQPEFNNLMQASADFPLFMQLVVSIGFLAAFMIRLPVFPLHKANSDILYDSITPVSMMLSGILFSTAAYGLIRINLQLFYEMFQILAPALILLGAAGIIWASYLAISQNDTKKITVYYTIAQMNIILIGASSFTEFGLNGAIFHIISTTLVSAGLFVGIELIYMKFKTRKLEFLGGISKFTPTLTILMLILCLAAMAMPFTMSFSGEFLSFNGAFNSPLLEKNYFGTGLIQGFIIFAALSIILSGAYILRLLHKTFFGIEYDIINDFNKNGSAIKNLAVNEIKLSRHQITVLTIIVSALIIFGIYPMGIIDKISTFVSTNISNIISTIF